MDDSRGTPRPADSGAGASTPVLDHLVGTHQGTRQAFLCGAGDQAQGGQYTLKWIGLWCQEGCFRKFLDTLRYPNVLRQGATTTDATLSPSGELDLPENSILVTMCHRKKHHDGKGSSKHVDKIVTFRHFAGDRRTWNPLNFWNG